MANQVNDGGWTIGAASRALGYSPDYIRKLVKNGLLKAARLQNGTRVFDPKEIERFKQERSKHANQDSNK